MERTFKRIKKSLTSRSQRTAAGERSASGGTFGGRALTGCLARCCSGLPRSSSKVTFSNICAWRKNGGSCSRGEELGQLRSDWGGLETRSLGQRKVGGCGRGRLEECGGGAGGAPGLCLAREAPARVVWQGGGSAGARRGCPAGQQCSRSVPGGEAAAPALVGTSSAPGVTEISSNAEWGCNKFFKLAAAAASPLDCWYLTLCITLSF